MFFFVDSTCGYIGYSQAAQYYKPMLALFHFPISALSHQDMEVKHMHSMQNSQMKLKNICKWIRQARMVETNLYANDYGTERGLNLQVFRASPRKVAVEVGRGISLDFGTGH